MDTVVGLSTVAEWLGVDGGSASTDDVRVVDVRDAWEYDGIGHLPGAVNVPFDSFRSATGGDDGMLPGADAFAELVESVGISSDDRLVAYDDMHGVFAARFLVTCELYGHDPDRLHLLNGDYSAWNRSYSVSQDTPSESNGSYDATALAEGPLVGVETVEQAMDDSSTVLVDTREKDEYAAGHIPGAVRLNWMELVDETDRGIKSDATLRSILEDAGIRSDQSIVLYCNTARRLSHTYTVLRHLGYPALSFYEGSLTEWRDRDLPLAADD